MQHHAYIYEGSLALLPTLTQEARERFGFEGEHNPDVHVREFEKFGIDESRWLVETAALKSASGKSLFVIGISSITTEAQQALLKLLEEPQQGTIFVLLMPHGVVLPTIRSRMADFPGLLEASEINAEVKKFLRSAVKERNDFISTMLKDDEGVKETIRNFLNALEVELSKRMSDAKVREGLEDITHVRDYLRDRSPSLKMLLEHLALSLPTV